MPRTSGRADADVDANSGAPHSPQNARRATCPLSAVVSKYRGSPDVSRKAARLTASVGAYPPPPTRWQSRQWQLTIASGAAEHSYRTAPHAQPPANRVRVGTDMIVTSSARQILRARTYSIGMCDDRDGSWIVSELVIRSTPEGTQGRKS